MTDEVAGLTLGFEKLVNQFDEILRGIEPAPPPRPLTIADLEYELDRLTTKVVCHPDRAATLRAAIAAADPPLPLVRVIEDPYIVDPSHALVIKPSAGLYPTVGEP